MSEIWKERGDEKSPYKARQISHESNTSIEYGEKTWTTAQTIRDLMQNHLDAETEKYYRNISLIILDQDKLQELLEGDTNGFKKEVNDFLYSVCMFLKHESDMTLETRAESEEYLEKLSEKFPINENVKTKGKLDILALIEQSSQFSEQVPLVSYEVIDGSNGESKGFISYEALRDEELYQEKLGGDFRFQIQGMKVVDRGSGYDSQLSALYLSSKTEKKHTRGKFGEGSKMSELHLLRHGAKMKMRSQYTIEEEQGKKNRHWQTRPKVREERLVSVGVEVEKEGSIETGSMIHISLKDSDEAFKKEFLDNSDPRLDGLAKNIMEYCSNDFIYPMPISEKSFAGVNMYGNGYEQFVKGLRVELATGSIFDRAPWFSYDIWDSKIINGRDRNEIKTDINNSIHTFWKENDNPEALKRLVNVAVKDRAKKGNSSSVEAIFLESVLIDNISSAHEKTKRSKEEEKRERQQKIIDEALINELSIKKGVKTLVVSQKNFEDHKMGEYFDYAINNGYEIKRTVISISNGAMSKFGKRVKPQYDICTLPDIIAMVREEKEINKPEDVGFVEGRREKAIREVFGVAVNSVNSFMGKLGIEPIDFNLKFTEPKVSKFRFDGRFDYGDDYDRDNEEEDPIVVIGYNSDVFIDPSRVTDPLYFSTQRLQKQIEVYLISAFDNRYFESETMDQPSFDLSEAEQDWNQSDDMLVPQKYEIGSEFDEGGLKGSQRLLDKLITGLIPEDSPILADLPSSLGYEKNPEVILRLVESLLGENGKDKEKKRLIFEGYKRARSLNLTLEEAQELSEEYDRGYPYINIRDFVRSNVFVSDEKLSYFNQNDNAWENIDLADETIVAEWSGRNVHKLRDGRYFVDAPMGKGAVLSQGEGKNRGYVFNEGDSFLAITKYHVKFHNSPHGFNVSVHPAGFIIGEKKDRDLNLDDDQYVQKKLDGHKYYPSGVSENIKNNFSEGLFSTAIPVEYGKDEWDNPVRVFQDIIQNHIDASDGKVSLLYEVMRDENKVWVREDEIKIRDVIVGLKVKDKGKGYVPSEIATMGASSKKSPLFAGKYGEGQKMVGAAALRNGFDLEYKSTTKYSDEINSWSARAVRETRDVVLDGKKVKKDLVAFDVKTDGPEEELGSQTILRLSEDFTANERDEWEKWVKIIDPRNKDTFGNSGMGRFVRQLREKRKGREYSIGSITLLLDEPGAVYENGLRINQESEKGRNMSFGYDVPEIVTTRERNSYDRVRLEWYIWHIISQITDRQIAKEILQKMLEDKEKKFDLDIGYIIYNSSNASYVWQDIVEELWPDSLVYSSEKIRNELSTMDEYGFPVYLSGSDSKDAVEKAKKARAIRANLVHLDKSKILDVSMRNYNGFTQLMPTVEDFVERLETKTVPISPEIRGILSGVVAESGKIFREISIDIKEGLPEDQKNRNPLTDKVFETEIEKWTNREVITNNERLVAVAPISSSFHGKADNGVVFNEGLLIGNKRRDLAEVSLHEVAHLVSGESDYTENFVYVLYELAKYFLKDRVTA